jgi:hypothetical protein
MPDRPKQPVIVLLTSHWVRMAGVALVTLAAFRGFFALPNWRERVDQEAPETRG